MPTKKPDLSTKTAQYFIARKKGHNQKEALKIAGYSPNSNNQSTALEKSEEFGKLREYFADKLLQQIDLKDIASELKKNIVQDQDKGAKNTAIKIALDKIEPEQRTQDNDNDIVVVLRPAKVIEAKEEKVIEGAIEKQ